VRGGKLTKTHFAYTASVSDPKAKETQTRQSGSYCGRNVLNWLSGLVAVKSNFCQVRGVETHKNNGWVSQRIISHPRQVECSKSQSIKATNKAIASPNVFVWRDQHLGPKSQGSFQTDDYRSDAFNFDDHAIQRCRTKIKKTLKSSLSNMPSSRPRRRNGSRHPIVQLLPQSHPTSTVLLKVAHEELQKWLVNIDIEIQSYGCWHAEYSSACHDPKAATTDVIINRTKDGSIATTIVSCQQKAHCGGRVPLWQVDENGV
jgi:hypothetical protein